MNAHADAHAQMHTRACERASKAYRARQTSKVVPRKPPPEACRGSRRRSRRNPWPTGGTCIPPAGSGGSTLTCCMRALACKPDSHRTCGWMAQRYPQDMRKPKRQSCQRLLPFRFPMPRRQAIRSNGPLSHPWCRDQSGTSSAVAYSEIERMIYHFGLGQVAVEMNKYLFDVPWRICWATGWPLRTLRLVWFSFAKRGLGMHRLPNEADPQASEEERYSCSILSTTVQRKMIRSDRLRSAESHEGRLEPAYTQPIAGLSG